LKKEENINKWVIDASCASLLFLQEKSAKKVEEFFEALDEEQEVLAPSIWWYELGNVVSNAVKTNRIEANDAAEIFELWELLPITNDHQQNIYTIHNIYKLSKKTGLTVYDAAYLESAIRNKAGLATFDRELQDAAKKISIKLF